MQVLRIWDSHSELLYEGDYDPKDNCKPMGIGEYCGGCDNCLIMQASHLDLLVEIIDETEITE